MIMTSSRSSCGLSGERHGSDMTHIKFQTGPGCRGSLFHISVLLYGLGRSWKALTELKGGIKYPWRLFLSTLEKEESDHHL